MVARLGRSVMAAAHSALGGTKPRIALACLSAALLSAVAATVASWDSVSDPREALLSGNYQAAHRLLLEPARNGDSEAQVHLGNLYYLGLGVKQDHRRAAAWYLPAALKDNPAAQVNLGHLYAQGLGVAPDLLRALGWYWQAGRGGSRMAEAHLRLIIGGAVLTPNQIQKAQRLYDRLEDLRPDWAEP